jgi:GGDEF domain-containing protein
MSRDILSAEAAPAVVLGLPVGAMLSDPSDMVLWANDAFCALLAAESGSVVGAPVAALLGDRSEVVGADCVRYTVDDDSGRRRWLECRLAQLDLPGLGPVTLRCVTDISSFESRRKARAAVASGLDRTRIDPESGALTRKAVMQELNSQISRSRRYGNPLSGLLVRFSDCGRLDEAEVHDEANRALVAERLREGLRWVDFVGVLAPGEYLVVLPETDVNAAGKVVAKLRESLGNTDLATAIAATTWKRDDDAGRLLDRLRAEFSADSSVANACA